MTIIKAYQDHIQLQVDNVHWYAFFFNLLMNRKQQLNESSCGRVSRKYAAKSSFGTNASVLIKWESVNFIKNNSSLQQIII